MKKYFLILAFSFFALFMSSCTRVVNMNGEIVTDHKQTIIPDEILNVANDSTEFNKNIVFSADSETAYVMIQGKDGPKLLYTMQSETEDEVPSIGLFIMLIIILFILL